MPVTSTNLERTVNDMDYLDEDKLREWDELSLNSRIYNEANKPESIDRILYAAACGIKNAGNEDDCTEEAARQYGYNYSNECPGMVQPARDGFIAGAEWKEAQMKKEAVECELYWDGDFLAIDLNMAELGYSERDKVRIIVLPKDEKK